jgi:hypothetical protein
VVSAKWWRTFVAVALCSGAVLSTLAPASGATSATIISVPGVASISGVSADGRYLIYQSGGVVNWLDTQTGTDIALANVGNGVQISADGQHVVFQDFGDGGSGTDPIGPGLLEGTVYEWTANGDGPGTYTQVSPIGGDILYAWPTANDDGSLVVYTEQCCQSPDDNFIWNASSNTTIDVPGHGGSAPVLSADGSIFGTANEFGTEIDEFSTSDGSFVRSMSFAVQVSLWALSADGLSGAIFQNGTQTSAGFAYVDLTSGSEQVIANTFNTACTPASDQISISSDGSTVAFGMSSDGLVPNNSGTYDDYFTYDPAAGKVTNLTNGSAGPSPNNGGICPSMALSSDGQNLVYADYEPSGTGSSSVSKSSGRADTEMSTSSGTTKIDQITIGAVTHAVTFKANGGTGSLANEIESAPTALTLNAFTRSGYSFAGWNTAKKGTGSTYANGAIYPFTASVTLYAQWVEPASQTITFGELANKTLAQSPVTVGATASSGLPVTFTTTTSAVCTAGGTNGAIITLHKTGKCTVQANQAGDATYSPATAVSQSFTVSKAPQTISFGTLADKTLAQHGVTVSATASSGLTVTFTTTTSAECTSGGTNGHTITLHKAGKCTVQANQAGDATYSPATAVSQSFTVTGLLLR